MSTLTNFVERGRIFEPRQDAEIILTIAADQRHKAYGFQVRGYKEATFLRAQIGASRWAADVKSPLEASWWALLSALRSISQRDRVRLRELTKSNTALVAVNTSNAYFAESFNRFNQGKEIGVLPYLTQRVADFREEFNLRIYGQRVANDLLSLKRTFSFMARMCYEPARDSKSPHIAAEHFITDDLWSIDPELVRGEARAERVTA